MSAPQFDPKRDPKNRPADPNPKTDKKGKQRRDEEGRRGEHERERDHEDPPSEGGSK